MAETIIQIAQMIISILLVAAILIQHKGAGLGAGFGGGNAPIVQTRRGVDLFLHKMTISLAIIFFALALAGVII